MRQPQFVELARASSTLFLLYMMLNMRYDKHNEDKSTHNIDNSQIVNNTNQTVTNTFIIRESHAAILQNIDPQIAETLKLPPQMYKQLV